MRNFLLCLICATTLNLFASSLEKNFQNPPDSACAETWYHFTSSAITKEGITADIEAMRDIGYKGAHVFTTGGSIKGFDKPVGIMSPQWQEMMEHLGREAKRCGIKLGMHNCTGWSSSGGPWIKPEDSMKKLTCTELFTSGGDVSVKLAVPESLHNFYRDIMVLAIPAKEKMPTPKVITNLVGGENFITKKSIIIPTKKRQGGVVCYEFAKPYSAKFAKVVFNPVHVYITLEVSVSDNGKDYKKVARLEIDSFRDNSVPKFLYLGENTKGKFYKFEFIPRDFPSFFKTIYDTSLNSITLIQEPIINSVEKKISLVNDYRYIEPKRNTMGIPPSEIINLTDKMAEDGTLNTTLPSGYWKILRIGFTTTGATNAPSSFRGLECDKLSKRGLDAHWEHYVGKMQKWFGGALKYALIDSYEVGGQNWTEDFDTEFKKRRGYNIEKFLPCVFGYVVGDEKQSSKFLYDFQKTISELFCENYYDYFHHICKKNGLTSAVEPYRGPFDFIRASRYYDIALSEFWVRGETAPKSISSIANLYGKTRCATESFTSSYENGRWSIDPAEFKIYGDNAWSVGVNSFIMHTYVHQPFNAGPGLTLGRHGSDFHRLNTWWHMGDAWISYINRAQTLLQIGTAVRQILIVSPASSPNDKWDAGKDMSILGASYDYDIASVEDLGELLYVDKGKVRASENGASYNLLVVEDNRINTIAKIKAIEKLVADGANVLAERPVDSPSLSDDKVEFNAIVERIWGGEDTVKKIGKGKLFTKGSPVDTLIKLGVLPKCVAKDMITVCRTNGSQDVFYIVNTTKKSFNRNVFFSVSSDKIPQLWCANTGKIENIVEYKRTKSGVEIPLYFDANDSKFIVFVKGKGQGVVFFNDTATTEIYTASVGDSAVVCFEQNGSASGELCGKKFELNVDALPNAIDISDDWKVSFQKDRGAPDSINLEKIRSLSESTIDGVKHFSGTMQYEKIVEINSQYMKDNRQLILSFDEIYNIAQVEINGHFVQTLWKPPYRCDITKYLKEGKNIIKVKVANLWVNRLIGDDRYPHEFMPKWVLEGKTKSETKRFTAPDWVGAWKKTDKLFKSGLVGKVQIKPCDIIPIKNN